MAAPNNNTGAFYRLLSMPLWALAVMLWLVPGAAAAQTTSAEERPALEAQKERSSGRCSAIRPTST